MPFLVEQNAWLHQLVLACIPGFSFTHDTTNYNQPTAYINILRCHQPESEVSHELVNYCIKHVGLLHFFVDEMHAFLVKSCFSWRNPSFPSISQISVGSNSTIYPDRNLSTTNLAGVVEKIDRSRMPASSIGRVSAQGHAFVRQGAPRGVQGEAPPSLSWFINTMNIHWLYFWRLVHQAICVNLACEGLTLYLEHHPRTGETLRLVHLFVMA